MNTEEFECFEAIYEPNKMPPLTSDNLKALKKMVDNKISILYNKYINGGSSPKKTYLQIAKKYIDVDDGYSKYINE